MNDEEQSSQNQEQEAPVKPAKRRGRPPKAEAATAIADAPAPIRRGRPRKSEAEVVTNEVVTSSETQAPKRRGRPPKAAVEAAKVPPRRVVVRQGSDAPADNDKARRGRPRRVAEEARREETPARRIVLRQGVTPAQYRKALAELAADAELVAVKAVKATKPDTRVTVSMAPDYTPPARRIVVRAGAMQDYLASLLASESAADAPEVTVAPSTVSEVAVEAETPAQPLRRKRITRTPRASLLDALARRVDGEVAGLVLPEFIPELVYAGEPPAPRKRPGRKPAAVPKKRRAKAAKAKGGSRRGRKPRKPGVLSAGARRRVVAPE